MPPPGWSKPSSARRARKAGAAKTPTQSTLTEYPQGYADPVTPSSGFNSDRIDVSKLSPTTLKVLGAARTALMLGVFAIFVLGILSCAYLSTVARSVPVPDFVANTLPQRWPMILCLLPFGAVGIAMLVYLPRQFSSTLQFANTAYPAEARIVRFVRVRGVYFPVVRFPLPNGEDLEIQLRRGQYPNPWKVGDSVQILFHPDHPEKTTLRRAGDVWFRMVLMALIGVAVTILVLLVMALALQAG